MLGSSNSKNGHEQHFCISCLQGFHSEKSRDEHFEYCKYKDAVKIVMPEKGSKIRFTDGEKQFKVPFIMYADFESSLMPVKDDMQII